MLPKAEGCCTGLQLSAKEVVLGRPDMITLFPNHLLFLPSSSSFCFMLGCQVNDKCSIKFSHKKKKKTVFLAFHSFRIAIKKTSDVFLLQDKSVWIFNMQMIWGWGKNTILSPPFPWRGKKEGEILKIYIYISRETGANT